MEDPSVLPSPHRDRVSPSRREPWRGWHIGVARRGCSQPPLSPAAAAAPDSASPASSLSQADPSCHPGTLRPPRLRGGGAPPPELGVPSQTDKMVERWGRSVDRSWPPQVLAPRPRPQATCGSCRQPWAPGARAGRMGFPWAALMVPPQPPRRRGFGGVVDSWSPLGPKTWAGGWLDQGEERPRPAICAQRPVAPSLGQHLSLPGGHSFVFCEDRLAMRLSFIPICIFYKCLDQTLNKPPIFSLLSPTDCPPATSLTPGLPAASALSLARPDPHASCAQAAPARPQWAPLWAVWRGRQEQLWSLAPSPTSLAGFLC